MPARGAAPTRDAEVSTNPFAPRVPRGLRSLALLGLAAIAVMMLLPTVGPAHATSSPAVSGSVAAATASHPLPAASINSGNLSLGIATHPGAICANDLETCPAGAGVSRVTLTAQATGQGTEAWPAVQVAFILETTLYDGVFAPNAGEPGLDPCALSQPGTSTACEESNGIPFFIANAQQIASGIQAANPHSQVSFALVDYFATLNNWDDGDGLEYHVDIPQFIPAADFGTAVTASFQAITLGGNWYYGDSDFSDNFLHSSSITALYGTIIGSGLDWANNTHHVIVWIGSTAPRDPGYPENYCVSPSQYMSFGVPPWACIATTCEPSYTFATGTSPECEGWIHSQDGNQSHSIAALAHTAKQCTESIGGDCTIDMIDLWTTPTDPYSQGWPTKFSSQGGGPGGFTTLANVANVIRAGCDMAAATGGTWDGPAFASCPDGQTGTLQYVQHGSFLKPNTANPSLFNALKLIGFGPITKTQVASGAGHPIFAFVPYGSIAPAPDLQATAACERGGETFKSCQTTPQVLQENGVSYLGWNWSTNASLNTMYLGDAWTASFNVIATGPPYAQVPLDACTTTDCRAGGSGAIAGLYTWASFVPASNTSVVTNSFPLARITVEVAQPVAAQSVPPPAPPVPPPFPIAAPAPLPAITQVGVGNSVGIGTVSLQAAAAGFLGAGFMRVTMKNRPIAMRVAAKSGKFESKFDAESRSGGGGVGRFE